MPTFMIIGDGMADLPLEELGGRTPLEASDCINMGKLCSKGCIGLLHALGPGIVAESESAIMTILGYTPPTTQISRGPLEALGADLTLEDNDVAFRCNLSFVDKDLRVVKERTEGEEIDDSQFIEHMQNYCSTSWGVEFLFRRTWKFKCVLVLRGENLSSKISTPPPLRGEIAPRAYSIEDTPAASRTATIINAIIRESNKALSRSQSEPSFAINGHTNAVIPWGVGKRLLPEPFYPKYGLKAACVGGAALIKGIGKFCEMTTPAIPGATGGTDTNTGEKAEAAITLSRNHDFILLHVGGPDEASHDGDAVRKISIIEKIDSMLGEILQRVSLEETTVILLSDHTSSTASRRHTSHPTPIVITGGRIKQGKVKQYNESAAANGELGQISGTSLMKLVLGQPVDYIIGA